MAEAAGDALFVLPLALWQFHSTGLPAWTARAWIAAVVMGVVCTAIPYTLWIDGTRRVRVEHVTILGYIEPVAGPLYAVFLVGQLPGVWTVDRRRADPRRRAARRRVRPRRGRGLGRRGLRAGAAVMRAMSAAPRGYLLVAGSFLIMGMIGALVDWATAPESALLVLRFATAGIVLGVVFARRRPLAGAAGRSVWPRLLLMGVVDAFTLLLFFVAIRGTSVAIGMFLQFLAPVWVALLAPRVFRTGPSGSSTRRWRSPSPAWPSSWRRHCSARASSSRRRRGRGPGRRPRLRRLPARGQGPDKRVSAVTIVFTEAWLDALILLPLALWQTVGAGYHLTTRDLVAGLVLGVVCTALAYTMWTAGMGMIKVQHSSILGYLEPVSAPLYALLLLGQGISSGPSPAARSSWSPACSWCCSASTRRRAPSPWSRRRDGRRRRRRRHMPGCPPDIAIRRLLPRGSKPARRSGTAIAPGSQG